MIVWSWAARLILTVLAVSAAARLWTYAWQPPPPGVDPRVARSAAYGAGVAAGVKLRQNGADRMTCESQRMMSASRFPADPMEQRDFRRGYRAGYDGHLPGKSSWARPGPADPAENLAALFLPWRMTAPPIGQ